MARLRRINKNLGIIIGLCTIIIIVICGVYIKGISYNSIFKEGFETERPPKVAMLFGGRVKGYEAVNDSLKAIKDKYNATVFCSLNKVTKSNYIKGFCDIMSISDDRLNLEKTPKYPEYLNNVTMADTVKGKWGDGVALESVYSFFYHLDKAFKLIEDYQTKNNMMFDIVLYYRADIETKADLTFKLPIKDMTVYVPVNEPSCDYGGLCAQLAYGNYKSMKYYCNMIDSIKYMTTEQRVVLHAETIIKKHLENGKINIERFSYVHTLTQLRHQPNPDENIE